MRKLQPLTVERASGRCALTLVVVLVGGCGIDVTPTVPTPARTAGSAGCAEAPAHGPRSVELRYDGVDRVYDIVVPDTAPGVPLPVVFGFHGFTGSSGDQAIGSGLGVRALSDGFIAIFPQGSDLGGTTPAYFNIETTEAPTLADDVGFTAAILDATEAELCVDPSKVYAMGLSNGGMFSATLGCELGDRIAAIAPVAGVHLLPECGGRPMPLIVTHGTEDPLVPFADDDVGPRSREVTREIVLGSGGTRAQLRMFESVTATSVESWVESWARRNGCSLGAPVVTETPDVETTAFVGCRSGGDVVLQVVPGGGHDWPVGAGFDATDRALEFFWRHPLPAGSSG